MSAPCPPGLCPLCGRPLIPGPSVNAHHPLPRRYGGRDTVGMHRICHDKLHAVFSDAELRALGPSLDHLRAHPAIAAFARWVARKPPDFVDGHHTGRQR
jgi:hypothetical protein